MRDHDRVRAFAQVLAVLTLLMCLASLWTVERGCSLEAPVSALEMLAERVTIALPMPLRPLPRQQRAPCPRPQREVNGGCWQGYVVAGTDAEIAKQCAEEDVYELSPGACLKTRRVYVPVFATKPNSVK